MLRAFAAILWAFAAAVSASALTVTSGAPVLVPHDVYVGDRASLMADFSSAEKLLTGENGALPSIANGALGERAVVHSAEVTASGGGYTLTLTFTPWEIGLLSFPPLPLTAEGGANFGEPVFLTLAPVHIESITEKLGEHTMRPPSPPALVPGTSYILLALVFLALAAAFLLVLAIARAAAVKKAVAKGLRTLFFSAAGRRARKALKKLGGKHSPPGDADYGAALEKVLRTYLEERYRHAFTALTSPEAAEALKNALHFAGSPFMEDRAYSLAEVFFRCDYVRYGGGDDSGFAPEERKRLAQKAFALVTALEKGPETREDAYARV